MGTYKIKFPCGFEIQTKAYGVELANINDNNGILSYIKNNGCLIHGKKCKTVI